MGAPTSAMPETQTAIMALESGNLAVQTTAVPKLEPDKVLVRVRAVALNPVDSKMVGKLATPGAMAGFDFAGEVIAVGSNAKTVTPLQIGDRVCSAVHGMHSLTPKIGAFAEYVCADSHVLLKIPEGMAMEDAAGFGVGVGTVGLALFKSLDVPGKPESPAKKPEYVLVYGGSTASGTLAIQLLKLSGLLPITTCSPRNFALVKDRGAVEAFDYSSPTCAQDIKTLTKNSLRFVLDCVTTAESITFCYSCFGRLRGKYTGLEPHPQSTNSRSKTVKADWVLFMDVFGKKVAWPPPFEREESGENREWAVEYYGVLQRLLEKGLLKPHPVRLVDGGFEGILAGLDMIRDKKVSGEKLVCKIA